MSSFNSTPPAHPFSNILSDCLSIIFSHHILTFSHDNTKYSPKDILFLRRFIVCYEFGVKVHVREFLERCRGQRLVYVSAKCNLSLDNETFKLFRGIRELDVQFAEDRFTDEALENLRGIETLNLKLCTAITSAGFVNLRGVKNLSMRCLLVDDSALEHLRGIKRLNMAECWNITPAGIANLRGIQSLNISGCPRLNSACFENLRGIKELKMTSCSQERLASSAFENLRGIQKLWMDCCTQISGDAFQNLIGIQELDISECPQITDDHLRYLVGVKKLNISKCDQITGSGLLFARGVQEAKLLEIVYPNHDFLPALREAKIVEASLPGNEQMLSNLRRAKCVTLCNSSFTDDSVFANLANAEELTLSCSSLQGITDEMFRYMPRLRVFSIQGCKDTKFTKRMFEYLPQSVERLELLHVSIRVSDEDVDKLVNRLARISMLVLPNGRIWEAVRRKLSVMPVGGSGCKR